MFLKQQACSCIMCIRVHMYLWSCLFLALLQSIDLHCACDGGCYCPQPKDLCDDCRSLKEHSITSLQQTTTVIMISACSTRSMNNPDTVTTDFDGIMNEVCFNKSSDIQLLKCVSQPSLHLRNKEIQLLQKMHLVWVWVRKRGMRAHVTSSERNHEKERGQLQLPRIKHRLRFVWWFWVFYLSMFTYPMFSSSAIK